LDVIAEKKPSYMKLLVKQVTIQNCWELVDMIKKMSQSSVAELVPLFSRKMAIAMMQMGSCSEKFRETAYSHKLEKYILQNVGMDSRTVQTLLSQNVVLELPTTPHEAPLLTRIKNKIWNIVGGIDDNCWCVRNCALPSCTKRSTKSEKFRKCSQCKEVSYCSEICQKAHWRQHKDVCKPRNPQKNRSQPAVVDSVHTVTRRRTRVYKVDYSGIDIRISDVKVLVLCSVTSIFVTLGALLLLYLIWRIMF